MSRTDTQLSPAQPHATWTVMSGQVEAFIQAWEAGGDPPSPAPFLPAGDPAVRRMTLIELIKVDLEYRWIHQRGPRPLEEYLRDFPELGEKTPADLVYEEYHVRRQAGEPVRSADYLKRFPTAAREVERLFALQKGDASTALVGRRTAGELAILSPGDRLDDFDLLAHLGAGAFAGVYLARQRSMQRLVALKVSGNRGTEPQTLAQLDHEHIVRVYDQRVIEDRGLRLMYMQYVAGGTLQSVIDAVRRIPEGERTGRALLEVIDKQLEQRGESPPAESPLRKRLAFARWSEVVCWLGARLARALDYAHRQGVLHRDIKPANVLVTAEGSPKLADFNISFSSKLLGATPAAYFGGSLAYMSPEQLEACNPSHERAPDSLDGRSDLYSLGVLLWELLTGARPFADEKLSEDWSEMLAAMVERRRAGIDPQMLREASRHWPAGLDRILATCLSANIDERFASGAELAQQLELCLEPSVRVLLSPAPRNWRRQLRRFPIAWVIIAAVIPNAAAAVFNYFYNRIEIVAHLQHAQNFFWKTQFIINSIAFPLGLGLAAWLSWPVARIAREPKRAAALPAAELERLRRRCLRLGHFAASISIVLWLVAAPAYPIALSMGVESVAPSVWMHFLASLTLCGLIAVAYPFFGVGCLSVCSFYPVLARLETMTRDDRLALARLGRAAWFYLFLALTVPMLSVAILVVVMGSQARFALGALSAGGVAGFIVAFVLFRTLQADLEALQRVASPAGEPSESVTQSFGGL